MRESTPDLAFEDEIASACASVDFSIVGSIEWGVASQKDVGDDTNGPDVGGLVVTSLNAFG